MLPKKWVNEQKTRLQMLPNSANLPQLKKNSQTLPSSLSSWFGNVNILVDSSADWLFMATLFSVCGRAKSECLNPCSQRAYRNEPGFLSAAIHVAT